MSYEGYAQHICENGHRYDRDVYDHEETCLHCGAKSVFYNGVDETNCDQYGMIPSDQWEKFKITEEKTETCNLGHVHVTALPTYRVPTNDEQIGLRAYWSDTEHKYIPLEEWSPFYKTG